MRDYLLYQCHQALSIGHGINNWLTCVSSLGKSFIIDGRNVKSVNQWYNKRFAELKTGKPQGYWSPELTRITEQRNRFIRDAVNKAARFIINHCLETLLSTIVFGWNEGQKKEPIWAPQIINLLFRLESLSFNVRDSSKSTL